MELAVYESIYSLLNVSTTLDLALLTLQVDVVPNVTVADTNGTNETNTTNVDEAPCRAVGGRKGKVSMVATIQKTPGTMNKWRFC